MKSNVLPWLNLFNLLMLVASFYFGNTKYQCCKPAYVVYKTSVFDSLGVYFVQLVHRHEGPERVDYSKLFFEIFCWIISIIMSLWAIGLSLQNL